MMKFLLKNKIKKNHKIFFGKFSKNINSKNTISKLLKNFRKKKIN